MPCWVMQESRDQGTRTLQERGKGCNIATGRQIFIGLDVEAESHQFWMSIRQDGPVVFKETSGSTTDHI